jgi:hypothetical protein
MVEVAPPGGTAISGRDYDFQSQVGRGGAKICL